jgi:hypothetical protein
MVLGNAQNQSFLGFKLRAFVHLETMWFFSNCGRERHALTLVKGVH